MSAPNILNLDELKVSKVVKFLGKDRVVTSMPVGEFIETADLQERLEEMTAQEQIKTLIGVVKGRIEDTTEAELHKLELPQLMALLSFIRGEDAAPEAEEGKADPQ